jgi:hypothetical protein
MSEPEEKSKASLRRHRDEVAIQRQVKIAKQHGKTFNDTVIKQPHRLSKHHATDCGNPACILCGNPRKTQKEVTQQEKRLFQDMDNVRDTHSNGVPTNDNDIL